MWRPPVAELCMRCMALHGQPCSILVWHACGEPHTAPGGRLPNFLMLQADATAPQHGKRATSPTPTCSWRTSDEPRTSLCCQQAGQLLDLVGHLAMHIRCTSGSNGDDVTKYSWCGAGL